ncbi:hypothetical protein Tco_0126931 [Tanacetum coccineum]
MMMVVISVDKNAVSGDENDASSDDNATSGDENDASGDKNDNMEGMEDIVDDEHIIDQIDVNMEGFRFTTNSDDERHTVGDSLRPQLNINEDSLEVTNYDEFESDIDEGDIGSTRRAALRKLRKQGIVPSMDDGTMESSIGKRKDNVLDKGNQDKHKVTDKANKGKKITSEVVKQCTSTFLSKHVTNIIHQNPEIPIKALQDQMKKQFQVGISKHKAFRVKAKVVETLKGDAELQYGMLRDYVMELKKSNPNTIVKIDVYMDEDLDSTTKFFRRIYVCLSALKDGFRAGGRDLLGLDGAFMEVPYEGHLLNVVSVDANNSVYPVAYGIVESESLDL